jgi:energy-coupling factor transport system permease protein
MNKRAADYFHPLVTFSYTIALTLLAMLFFHPAFIALGLAFAVLQNLILCGWRKSVRQLAWSLPLCVVVAAFNPIVNHGGKTLLFYLWGSPITLEAALYGVCSGGMLLTVFLWFGVYNHVVTPDRFMYLFSRFAPAASMLVTMTQRMVPLFTRRFHEISSAQKTLTPAAGKGNKKARLGAVLKEISILLSWSMEEGLDTADSMKARGYGCAKRSAFSTYRFTRRDAAALAAIAILTVICVAGYYASVSFYFYPRIRMSTGLFGILSAVAYIILAAALPLTEARWSIMWKIRGAKGTEVKRVPLMEEKRYVSFN